MKSLSLVTKLRLMAAVSSCVLVLMSGFLLMEEYQLNRTGRERAVQQNVEVAHSVLEWAYQQGNCGHAHARAGAKAGHPGIASRPLRRQ